MSGAGTAAKPRHRFCWVCSRQLHGNFHRVAIGFDGLEHIVHADCAKREGMQVIPGKHLAAEQNEAARLPKPRGH